MTYIIHLILTANSAIFYTVPGPVLLSLEPLLYLLMVVLNFFTTMHLPNPRSRDPLSGGREGEGGEREGGEREGG